MCLITLPLPLPPHPVPQIKAYVEVHMEQGPVLQSEGRALGPVAAIAGQTRLQAEIWGEQVGAAFRCAALLDGYSHSVTVFAAADL